MWSGRLAHVAVCPAGVPRHARDLQATGADLYEILSAGGWRSPAFLQYLDTKELEVTPPIIDQGCLSLGSCLSQADAVVEAHMEESSGDEN